MPRARNSEPRRRAAVADVLLNGTDDHLLDSDSNQSLPSLKIDVSDPANSDTIDKLLDPLESVIEASGLEGDLLALASAPPHAVIPPQLATILAQLPPEQAGQIAAAIRPDVRIQLATLTAPKNFGNVKHEVQDVLSAAQPASPRTPPLQLHDPDAPTAAPPPSSAPSVRPISTPPATSSSQTKVTTPTKRSYAAVSAPRADDPPSATDPIPWIDEVEKEALKAHINEIIGRNMKQFIVNVDGYLKQSTEDNRSHIIHCFTEFQTRFEQSHLTTDMPKELFTPCLLGMDLVNAVILSWVVVNGNFLPTRCRASHWTLLAPANATQLFYVFRADSLVFNDYVQQYLPTLGKACGRPLVPNSAYALTVTAKYAGTNDSPISRAWSADCLEVLRLPNGSVILNVKVVVSFPPAFDASFAEAEAAWAKHDAAHEALLKCQDALTQVPPQHDVGKPHVHSAIYRSTKVKQPRPDERQRRPDNRRQQDDRRRPDDPPGRPDDARPGRPAPDQQRGRPRSPVISRQHSYE